MSEVAELRKQVQHWSMNGDGARLNIRLGRLRAVLAELDRVEKERDEALTKLRDAEYAAYKRSLAKRDDDLMDEIDAAMEAEAAESALEQAVRALEAADHTLTVHGHIDRDTPLHERIRSLLSRRPQNREETDAENERIS